MAILAAAIRFMETFDRPTPAEGRLYAGRVRNAGIAVVVASALLLLVMGGFAPNRPVDHATDLEHFYYGSIGSDISGGLPVKVLQVLPRIFPDFLPAGATARDYTAFGFIQEPGQPLPIGFSIRRQLIDRSAINCAACHTGAVRVAEGQAPQIIAGMPANTVDLLAFFQFLFRAANDDDRFNASTILAAMEAENLDEALDGLFYRVVVPRMKDALRKQEQKLKFVQDTAYTAFGPGRVNTFDTFKFDQFAEYYEEHGQTITAEEIYGIADFPSIWNQAPREGLNLHWDGNNTSVRERNFSAAIGAGARPEDIDLPRLLRIESWLKTLPSPRWPFAVDAANAERGKVIYARYCADCHDFEGSRIGQVVAIDDIGTDRSRLDSYTSFLLDAQKDYTRAVPWTFSHFSKTNGYASHPLDGIWARAPYLHNGSVPNMWDLLSPEAERPRAFTTGSIDYDQERLGFRHRVLSESSNGGYVDAAGQRYTGHAFVLNTRLRGNGNRGHSGAAYGTTLSADEKSALIEYLKTK
jgi:hypothetical protein